MQKMMENVKTKERGAKYNIQEKHGIKTGFISYKDKYIN